MSLANLGNALLDAHCYEEAEAVQRECLSIRARELEPDSWSVAIAHFKLGRALLGVGRLAEAETHLSKGYSNLTAEKISEVCHANEYRMNSGRDDIQDGLTDIIRLYRSYDQHDKADRLKAELNRRLKVWGRKPVNIGD